MWTPLAVRNHVPAEGPAAGVFHLHLQMEEEVGVEEVGVEEAEGDEPTTSLKIEPFFHSPL